MPLKSPIHLARHLSTMVTSEFKAAAEDFLSFVNSSPTPFHAVKGVKERLTKAGFSEIKVSSDIRFPTWCTD